MIVSNKRWLSQALMLIRRRFQHKCDTSGYRFGFTCTHSSHKFLQKDVKLKTFLKMFNVFAHFFRYALCCRSNLHPFAFSRVHLYRPQVAVSLFEKAKRLFGCFIMTRFNMSCPTSQILLTPPCLISTS